MIRYEISSRNPATHYFDIKIHIDKPDPSGQCIRLPNWIPGSYMIRDFAKNIITMSARFGENPANIEQLDKSNWRIEPGTETLIIEYKVYARDLSVRGAHLDNSHGYYNGSSVFLEVLGRSNQTCEVQIEKPSAKTCHDWRLATSLPRKNAKPFEFGLYEAADYDELIDHPVEMGRFSQFGFEACGVHHDMVLTGQLEFDQERLKQDLIKICEHHIRFFCEPAPMDYYQFQVLVVGSGYGGLEHRSSTSLMCSRESLPQIGQQEVSEAYRDFLGLCSHEYFHTWNVKRLKPAVYQPYDLQNEVYTDLLWAFEGITSYYDDLALVRCGLIDQSSYLELLAQTLTRVQRGLGSSRQSAAESSFNTWTKFYKQDENAQNAIVSYYAKGCLIALCIDLKMRNITASRKSLDQVMQCLWQDWLATGQGIEVNTIQDRVCTLVDTDLQSFLHQMIYTTNDLPLTELLATVGINLTKRQSINQQDKGGKQHEGQLPTTDIGAFIREQEGGLQIQRVTESGSAQCAGLAAEDVIIAVNGLKLSLSQLEQKIVLAQVDDQWKIHAFRRDELIEVELTLQAAKLNTIVLEVTESQRESRLDWLGSGI